MKLDTSMLKTGPAGIAVDVTRGALALMVLVAHALESGLLMVKGSSLPPWMSVTLGHGSFWVNGFFVLSGFCIHRSIMAQRERAGEFVMPYALARITRLYPLYFLALVLALLISNWPDAGTMLSHLSMIQGVTGTIPSIKPAWSLTYEAVYYFMWPLVLMLCGWRVGLSFLWAGLGTLIVAAGLFVFWKRVQGAADNTITLPLALIAAQFPLWLGGAWMAQSWDHMLMHAQRWMAPASLLWIFSAYLLNAWLLYQQVSTYMIIATGWLVLPGWLGLVLGSSAWQDLGTWAASARWLGLLSYPLYILHQPLLDVLVLGGHTYHLSLGLPTSVILLITWVMLCMIVIGVPLEARLLSWRSYFLGKHRQHSLKAVIS